MSLILGLAFPTTISVNNVVAHFTPLPSDPEVELKDGDVVKVMMGIHLDGFAVTHAETVVLGSKNDGVTADVVKAAYEAAQIAMRTIKIGGKNWDVTEAVEKVAKEYGCVSVEGMLSCQHEKNVTDGKKRIVLNPSPEHRREHETITFEEGEVYGVDILLVTGTDGKVSSQDTSNTKFIGQARYIQNISVQACQRYQLSIKDEDFASCILRNPKEGRGFPIYSQIAR